MYITSVLLNVLIYNPNIDFISKFQIIFLLFFSLLLFLQLTQRKDVSLTLISVYNYNNFILYYYFIIKINVLGSGNGNYILVEIKRENLHLRDHALK